MPLTARKEILEPIPRGYLRKDVNFGEAEKPRICHCMKRIYANGTSECE